MKLQTKNVQIKLIHFLLQTTKMFGSFLPIQYIMLSKLNYYLDGSVFMDKLRYCIHMS